MIVLIQNMLLISDKHSVQSVQVNMLGALFYCGPYLHISAILMSSFLNIQISGSTSSASEHDRRSISLQRGFGSGPTSSLADCFLTMPVFIREFLDSLQCNVLYQYREFLQSACVYVNIFMLQCPQSPPGPTSLRPPSYAGSEDESNGSSSSSRTPR